MRWTCVVAMLMGCVEYNPKAPLGDEVNTQTGDTTPGGLTPGGLTPGGGPPTGEDVAPGWNVQRWVLEGGDGAVDVIFFGDTSGSMDEELRTMGASVTAFVDRLAQYVSDWQLGVVTGHTGCAVNGILTPSTPNYAELFAEAMLTEPPDGDYDETGLFNVAVATEASGSGECNEGLLRGGLLNIVFVTDENDESEGFDESADYWQVYLDRITAAHGNPSMVVASAVAGPLPDGCEGNGDQDAEPGEGYAEVVAATGGQFLSICDAWEDDIDLLAEAGVIRDRFPLNHEPVPGTIRVWLNNVELATDAWQYDEPINTVVLDVPARADDEVEIMYQLAQ